MKSVPRRWQKLVPPADTNPNRPKWTLRYDTTAGDWDGTAFEFFFLRADADTRKIATGGKITPFKPSDSRLVGRKNPPNRRTR